jgi:acetyltransferase-like isoleucine patch superfamily enzyme
MGIGTKGDLTIGLTRYSQGMLIRLRGFFFKFCNNLLFPFTRSHISWSYTLHIHRGGRILMGRNSAIRGAGILIVFENGTFIMGENASIQHGNVIYIMKGAHFRVGNNGYIGESNNIRCAGRIELGDNVRISQFVSLIDSQHRYLKRSILIGKQGFDVGKVTIGNDVWVGTNVAILPNVTIGNGVVVGAGSVVIRDIPDYAVVVGSPVRILRYRE